jgi:hypothetical protein
MESGIPTPLDTHTTNNRPIPSPPPQEFRSMTSNIVIRTASNGSVENERGYHGWIIALTDNTTLIKGNRHTDGRIQVTTSYRTKVSGTIAILAIYNMMVKVYNWKAKEIEHACDSESVLDRIWNTEPDGVFEQSLPDSDIILVEKALINKAKHTKIIQTWVRGKADKRGPPYTDQEDFNMRSDKLAGNAHTTLPNEFKARNDILHFPEQQISLCLHGQKVTSRMT